MSYSRNSGEKQLIDFDAADGNFNLNKLANSLPASLVKLKRLISHLI